MSGYKGVTPPPPSYAEALRYESGSGSNPSLGPPGVQPSAPTYQDNYYVAGQRLSLPRSGAQSSEDVGISDSPHSSDDEETARLKENLRRVREEKKKKILRDALEREESSLRGASGPTYPPASQYGSTQVPATAGYWQDGTFHADSEQPSHRPAQAAPSSNISYPTVTYNPVQGTSIQTPAAGTSQNASAAAAATTDDLSPSRKCTSCSCTAWRTMAYCPSMTAARPELQARLELSTFRAYSMTSTQGQGLVECDSDDESKTGCTKFFLACVFIVIMLVVVVILVS